MYLVVVSSSPPSLPSSQPPTREASPAPPGAAVAAGLMLATAAAAGANARTPPPKRWKRSFDMTHPINKNSGAATNGAATPGEGGAYPQLPLPMNLAEKYFQVRTVLHFCVIRKMEFDRRKQYSLKYVS